MKQLGLIALLGSACSFAPGILATATDAAPDGPPPITIGFAKPTTQTDEEAGTAQVRVVLSKAAAAAITVNFAVTGGSANRPADYLLNDGTLTFAPGDVEETIDIVVGPDGMAEPDETIALTLSGASGASGATLVNPMHTVTIAANVLPRVTFASPTSSGAEATSPTVDVVLDKMSLLTTAVDVTVTSGSATGGGTDYTLVTTTLTFAPGVTTLPVTLTVVDDNLDEIDEDVTLTLANATNLVVGTASTHMHTITDDDNPPTVAFDLISSTIGEAGTQVDLAVSLSGASGKDITVPFAVEASSTATGGGVDYTLVTATPLAFPAGMTAKVIHFTINNDAIAEGPESVLVSLATPNNATLGTIITHTLNITDDDATCLGRGATALCFANPAAVVSFSGNFNTDSNGLCSATAPVAGWTGGASACFVVGTSITVSGATAVTGSRPLVLFASGGITVNGNLDVASHRGGTSGPGSDLGCGTYTDVPGVSAAGAGGGAGGTFRTTGGNGGIGNGVANSGGSAIVPGAAPTTLRGGCTGQKGGDGVAGGGDNGGAPGAGGGALYLVAGGTITIGTGIVVNASGAGGAAMNGPDGGIYAGGGGGGSGGMIELVAQTFSVSGARIMANGGGGSTGADNNTGATSGFDPTTTAAANVGLGGTISGSGGNGGNGWGGTTAAVSGFTGTSTEGGGGGGGGGGFIFANATLTGTQLSAGEIVEN